MDERRYWELIEGAWQEVDGGTTLAALSRNEPPTEIEDRFRMFLASMIARLAAIPLDDARSVLGYHRASIRALDREQILNVVGWWKYDHDGEASALVPLLGEAFYRRVVASPDAAASLARASGLAALGGWRTLAEPVLARWRAELLAFIPVCFSDVPYPGDAEVTSGDWPTAQECRYFCGKDWREIDRSTLYRRYADLSFFSPRGLQYLLPAFLLAVLEDPGDSQPGGILILETLLFKLSYGHMRRCIALLSLEQRRVLGDVLRLRYEHWHFGPLAESNADLALALAQLDPLQPSPRRPQKHR